MSLQAERLPGQGWLALLGGGELTFGETHGADAAWLAKAPPGPVAFLPAASGSVDYGRYFAAYLDEQHGRGAETVPIYRRRDARRRKNLERLAACAAVYLGGGVPEHLLAVLEEEPVRVALTGVLERGGVVAGIAAAAGCLGTYVRGVVDRRPIAGIGWLPGGVVEPNFHPGHDRRLRQMLALPEVAWGLGIPAGSAVLLGPEGEVETSGMVFALEDAEGDYAVADGP